MKTPCAPPGRPTSAGRRGHQRPASIWPNWHHGCRAAWPAPARQLRPAAGPGPRPHRDEVRSKSILSIRSQAPRTMGTGRCCGNRRNRPYGGRTVGTPGEIPDRTRGGDDLGDIRRVRGGTPASGTGCRTVPPERPLDGAEADELVALYQRSLHPLSVVRSEHRDAMVVGPPVLPAATARGAIAGPRVPAWRESSPSSPTASRPPSTGPPLVGSRRCCCR